MSYYSTSTVDVSPLQSLMVIVVGTKIGTTALSHCVITRKLRKNLCIYLRIITQVMLGHETAEGWQQGPGRCWLEGRQHSRDRAALLAVGETAQHGPCRGRVVAVGAIGGYFCPLAGYFWIFMRHHYAVCVAGPPAYLGKKVAELGAVRDSLGGGDLMKVTFFCSPERWRVRYAICAMGRNLHSGCAGVTEGCENAELLKNLFRVWSAHMCDPPPQVTSNCFETGVAWKPLRNSPTRSTRGRESLARGWLRSTYKIDIVIVYGIL